MVVMFEVIKYVMKLTLQQNSNNLTHTGHWFHAKLSNILHFETVPILTTVLTDNFLLLLLYLSCTTIPTNIPFGYLLQIHHSPLLFYVVFIVDEADGVDHEIPQ